MNLQKKRSIDFFLGGTLMLLLRPLVRLLGRWLGRNHEPTVADKVVFVKMLGGGSLIIALPTILGLRKKYPSARFLLVTTPSVRAFAELTGLFDEIVLINDASAISILRTGIAAVLRCLRVDTVIDLEVYSRMTSLFSLATLARNRIGFYFEDIFFRKFLYTHLVFFNRFSPVHIFYEEIGHLLGAPPASAAESQAHLRQRIPETEAGRDEDVICIGQGCSDFGRERMLTPDQWATLLDLHRKSHGKSAFVFIGGPGDRELAERTIRIARERGLDHGLTNRCGELSLLASAREIRSAGRYWGIDSGLLHIARRLGVPCLSYWGPTAPHTRLQEIPGLEEEVVYRPIPCSPCIHVADTPPCAGNNVCMKGLFRKDAGVTSADLLFTAWPAELGSAISAGKVPPEQTPQ
jgi:ADP-heptose:LPS heptosyltransferase